MTTLRQAAQQALEVFEDIDDEYVKKHYPELIPSLRTALAEPEEYPPVECWKCGAEDGGTSCGLPECGLVVADLEQAEWDAISDEFNAWWDADIDTSHNPFREGSPAHWAWEGWKAAMKQRTETEQSLMEKVANKLFGGITIHVPDFGNPAPDDTALLRQALEALENLGRFDSRPSSIWTYFYASAKGDFVNLREFREKAEPAITALRERLGEKA